MGAGPRRVPAAREAAGCPVSPTAYGVIAGAIFGLALGAVLVALARADAEEQRSRQCQEASEEKGDKR